MTIMTSTEISAGTNSFQPSMSFYDIVSIVEALIFAAPEPISFSAISEVIALKCPEITAQEIRDTLAYLETSYQSPGRELGRGFELVALANGYVFRTVAYAKDFIQIYLQDKPQKLGPAQLEVLSIVAYRQPITRFLVEEIRGVDCSSSIKRLLSLKLIKILGKAEGIGKPLLYGTTKEFLELFSLNSLHDLPTLNEYRELDKNEEKTQIAEGVTVLDLFATGQPFQSEGSLKASAEAMASLDLALNRMVKAAKKIAVDDQAELSE